MLGKYINQFMADNELSVNEEFFIENMDGNRVLIGCADRYKIEDVDGGILTAAVMNEKDKPPAMLLEAALIDLLRENYLVKKKPKKRRELLDALKAIRLYGLPFSSSSGLISLLRNSLRQSCQLEVK